MIFEIQNLYENTFPKLSEQLFDNTPWPNDHTISELVDNDCVFITLYRELYYRHIYARMQPNLKQRIDAFFNYCDLFNYILNSTEPVPLELPDQWLWELIDEFVYQFQSFTSYKANMTQKTINEIQMVENSKVWDVLCVLNVLHYLIDKSKIKSQLEVYASGGDPDSVAGVFGRHSLYKMMGYFSLVGLLRVHSLLGDYYQAIKVHFFILYYILILLFFLFYHNNYL
jgi:translation initiation factor 3 subunit L